MKKIRLFAAVSAAMLILSACGADTETSVAPTLEAEPIVTATPAPTPEQTPEPEAEAETPKAETPTIESRVEKDGQIQSYLTGEWKSVDVANRRPMAVMTPNNKAALPQYGISLASVIIEAPVEGRITRLMAIYEDYDELDYLGPIRSAREYYIYEAMAYDAIFCNWGLAVPYCETTLASDKIDNVSQAVTGIHNPSAEAFDRVSRPGYKLEYTGYMFMNGYEKAVERHGYSKTYRSHHVEPFVFANDGWRSEYADKPDATMIYPGTKSGSNSGGYANAHPWFEYHEDDGLYYRYEYNAKQVDEYNGDQISVSNVVFKMVNGKVLDSHDYLWFDVEGSGEAYVFTNGKVIHGTWKRTGDNDANRFYDEDGNDVIFNQGKTWICEIWNDYAEHIEFE